MPLQQQQQQQENPEIKVNNIRLLKREDSRKKILVQKKMSGWLAGKFKRPRRRHPSVEANGDGGGGVGGFRRGTMELVLEEETENNLRFCFKETKLEGGGSDDQQSKGGGRGLLQLPPIWQRRMRRRRQSSFPSNASESQQQVFRTDSLCLTESAAINAMKRDSCSSLFATTPLSSSPSPCRSRSPSSVSQDQQQFLSPRNGLSSANGSVSSSSSKYLTASTPSADVGVSSFLLLPPPAPSSEGFPRRTAAARGSEQLGTAARLTAGQLANQSPPRTVVERRGTILMHRLKVRVSIVTQYENWVDFDVGGSIVIKEIYHQ